MDVNLLGNQILPRHGDLRRPRPSPWLSSPMRSTVRLRHPPTAIAERVSIGALEAVIRLAAGSIAKRVERWPAGCGGLESGCGSRGDEGLRAQPVRYRRPRGVPGLLTPVGPRGRPARWAGAGDGPGP